MTELRSPDVAWPELRIADWLDTRATLHMWTQIVGKIRLALTPRANHWWNVPLYLTARGLTTSPIPYGARLFELEFDFLAHVLHVRTAEGLRREIALAPRTVADFHREVFSVLDELRIDVPIWTTPVEIPDPIPFEYDEAHAAYDAEYAQRFWLGLLQADRVLKRFSTRFIGKQSPVHFFWGSFDLAVTRFSGRTAPPHPGAPNTPLSVVREAYSHEVSSCGFWPGGSGMEAAFYVYAYPEPAGFSEYRVLPGEARYSPQLREFLLPYSAVRAAASPDDALLDFAQSGYEAAAELGRWDRAAFERSARL